MDNQNKEGVKVRYQAKTIRKASVHVKALMRVSNELHKQLRRLDKEIMQLTDLSENYQRAETEISELIETRIESHFDLAVTEVNPQHVGAEYLIQSNRQNWRSLNNQKESV